LQKLVRRAWRSPSNGVPAVCAGGNVIESGGYSQCVSRHRPCVFTVTGSVVNLPDGSRKETDASRDGASSAVSLRRSLMSAVSVKRTGSTGVKNPGVRAVLSRRVDAFGVPCARTRRGAPIVPNKAASSRMRRPTGHPPGAEVVRECTEQPQRRQPGADRGPLLDHEWSAATLGALQHHGTIWPLISPFGLAAV